MIFMPLQSVGITKYMAPYACEARVCCMWLLDSCRNKNTPNSSEQVATFAFLMKACVLLIDYLDMVMLRYYIYLFI